MVNIRILVIEDDKVDQMAFKRLVKDENLSYNYTIAGSVSEATKILNSERFDIVITDYFLGDGTAFDIFDLIIDTPIIIVTGSGDEEIAVKAMKRGAYDYLIKDPERNYLKVLPIIVESAIARNKTEKALQESNQFNKAIISSASEGIIVYDPELRYVMWNRFMEELTGLPAEQVLGKYALALFPHLDEQGVYSLLQMALKGETVSSPDVPYYVPQTGKSGWVSGSYGPHRNASGEIIGVIGLVRNTTERKRAEEALRESEERYRLLADNATDLVWTMDMNLRFTYMSPSVKRIRGYSVEEAMAQTVGETLTPASLEIAMKTYTEELSIESADTAGRFRSRTLELGFKCKDGSTVWTEALMTFLRDSSGKPIGVLGVSRDITERRRAEEQIRKLSYAVEQSPSPVVITDIKGEIEYVNSKFTKVTGYTAGEAIGKNPRILSSGTHPPEFYKELWDTILSGNEWRGEFLNKKKNGELYWELASISPLWNPSGAITHFIAVKEDITERKRAEEEVQKAKEAAEIASIAKSQFLANMSHEIRTPMNAIIGMADLLWETQLTPEQQEYVRMFRRAGGILLNLINDLLDLSKAEAGHLDLGSVDFDLSELIEKTVEVMAIRAHEKSIELLYNIMPDVPNELVGDPDRLRQILFNLIGNAIKFTEKGEVMLSVRNDRKAKEAGSLLFSVSDTGIGIPSEKLDTIFDSFTQADSSITRKYGGTGLGLAICRQLIELMGGRIWAESEVDKGSILYFTAQFGVPTEPKKRVSLPADLKGLKTLVIDDNATNRLILREILSRWGALVTEAEGGEQGLAELKRAKEGGTDYQLLLLDCHMPGMDGFQVVEQVKEDPYIANTTIIMLTSDNRAATIAQCRELGIAGYLVKPIKRSGLLNAITATLSKSKSTVQEPPTIAMPDALEDQRALSILLVEDSEDNRLLIQFYLKKTQYQIDVAENGEVAVGKFKVKNYDLVLMDMQMPVMDGYMATQTIREWEEDKGVKRTPIIALTAYALKEEWQRSIDAGCTAHITKPVKKATLMEAIHEYTTNDEKLDRNPT